MALSPDVFPDNMAAGEGLVAVVEQENSEHLGDAPKNVEVFTLASKLEVSPAFRNNYHAHSLIRNACIKILCLAYGRPT